MSQVEKLIDYLWLMLGPFFRGWWALVTEVATFLSYHLTPATGWKINNIGALFICLVGFTLLFLALSAVAQSWRLFVDRIKEFEVQSIRSVEGLGDQIVVIRSGRPNVPVGTILDLHRKLGDVEVPFAAVEVLGGTKDGLLQAKPVWLSAAHLRDLKKGQFQTADLVVYTSLRIDRLREVSSVFNQQV